MMDMILEKIGYDFVKQNYCSFEPASNENLYFKNTNIGEYNSTSKLAVILHNTIEKRKAVMMKYNTKYSLKCELNIACKYCSFRTDSILVMENHKRSHTRCSFYQCRFCSMKFSNKIRFILHLEKKHICKYQSMLSEINRGYEKKKENHSVEDFMIDEIKNDTINFCSIVHEITESFRSINLNTSIDGSLEGSDDDNVISKDLKLVQLVSSSSKNSASAKDTKEIAKKSTFLKKNCHQNNNIDSPSAKKMKMAIVTKAIICEICDRRFKKMVNLKQHMNYTHKTSINAVQRPPLDCQKCPDRFFTDIGLMRHLLTHNLAEHNLLNGKKYPIKCPFCNAFLDSLLAYHIRIEHKIALKTVNLTYRCTVCRLTCFSMEEYREHISGHMEQDKSVHLGQKFTNAEYL